VKNVNISHWGEKKMIREIAALVDSGLCEEGFVGIGDDAAVTVLTPGKRLVTTTDMLVEGIHFLRGAVTAFDLGYKALAVNLSDLAAMGAKARYLYVSLALNKETEVDFVLDFYRGLKSLADRFAVQVAGGDTVGSPGPLVISITAQGEGDKVLLRSGANPGDVLCVTGTLGASAAGLLLLLNPLTVCSAAVRQEALQAHYRPVPRLPEGQYLAATGVVTAAIDLSDGLLKDLGEICERSGCGAVLREKQLPLSFAAQTVAALTGKDPLDLALSGGEDYELLLAVKRECFPWVAGEFASRFGTPLYEIGEMCDSAEILMIKADGEREKLVFRGFTHF
jgi:thiamine-monophosphate kinase